MAMAVVTQEEAMVDPLRPGRGLDPGQGQGPPVLEAVIQTSLYAPLPWTQLNAVKYQ